MAHLQIIWICVLQKKIVQHLQIIKDVGGLEDLKGAFSCDLSVR